MTAPMPSPVVLVRLRESTVALLMAQRQRDDETLDAVSARLARDGLLPDGISAIGIPPLPVPCKVATSRQQRESKYGLLLFQAETLTAATLCELFGTLIDRLAELAPEAVEKLAAMRSRRRAYVAREKNAIPPRSP